MDSDSLRLAGRLLVRGIDYTYNSAERAFDLSALAPASTDTLTVTYQELPSWVNKSYGRDIPEALASTSPVPIPPEPLSTSPASTGFGQGLRLSGAKTFRFAARNSGSDDFGQTLDLRIGGELAPGLTLTGALSDRGYDPAYGTATSRLNELDRLNLQLQSQTLLARIGDITLGDAFGGPAKNVSGASLALQYPTWKASAAAARPKGRFSSVVLTGENGFQGPYQIGEQGTAHPVVPGSETVYLDGRRLERGEGKDYTVDYPTGQITFSVRNPIDRRSRIEIDFEPLATSYRQELLATGAGVTVGDSTVTVSAEVLREGDDKEQTLLGELSDSDKNLLSSSGDQDAYRSGVRHDTTGDYVLVQDSLPDSVFQFVGSRQGIFDVTFSFVGRGKGTYAFLGSENYQYVGSGKGDYLPIVLVPRPERTDYYRSAVNVRTAAGVLSADVRQSAFDKNLWSSQNDNDNSGLFYSIGFARDWQWNKQSSGFKLERRVREATFRQRQRLNEADFGREYLLPSGYVPSENELLSSAQMTLTPLSGLSVTPSFAQLRYQTQFKSSTGGLGILLQPVKRVTVRSSWHTIEADMLKPVVAGSGHGNNVTTLATYQFSERYSLESAFEHDIRRDSYFGPEKGTRFNRWSSGIVSETEALRYERYTEDSLQAGWFSSATRDRITASTTRKVGEFSYTAAASWQHLIDVFARQSSFLGQTSANYNDAQRQLNVSASYLISEELRNARGITYLEVEPGRGNYVFEDGRYVPDPDGNYIQVEELLSQRAQVRRGEKSFTLSKGWRVAEFRFNSNIQEELLESGTRHVWWVLPFLTDEHQPYLFFARRYDANVRLIPWRSFHAITLLASDDIERRSIISAERQRHETKGSAVLRQAAGILYFDESLDLFRTNRDQYYSGIGAVSGYRVGGMIRRVNKATEVSGGLAYRRAKATEDNLSQTYSLLLGSRIRVLGQGELRSDIELYRQVADGDLADYSYQLTDSRYGARGAIWTVGTNYSIRKGMKLNLSVTGRHSDDRTARVTGRGEMVATF